MKHLLTSALLAASITSAAVIDRIGSPISPSQWDAFLPEPTHPSYASDLGSLQEGRLGIGLLDGNVSHLSLSVPGLQIISSHTRWKVESDQDRFWYDNSYGHLADTDCDRDFFQVAGGLRLSNFMTSLRHFDLGIGGTFTNQAVIDDSDRKIWTKSLLGTSASVRYRNLSLAGAWNDDEQRYRLGYREPLDVQAGIEGYMYNHADKSYGVQAGVEKTFRESVRFRTGLRWQWAHEERVENLMLIGTSIRFRPWREGVDPVWLRPFVAPGGGLPMVQRFLYDWELSADLMLDNQYGDSEFQLQATRWF